MIVEIEYWDFNCVLRVVEEENERGKFYEIDLIRVELHDQDVSDLLFTEELQHLHRKFDLEEEAMTDAELHIVDVNKTFSEIEEGAIEKYCIEYPIY